MPKHHSIVTFSGGGGLLTSSVVGGVTSKLEVPVVLWPFLWRPVNMSDRN